MQDAKEEVRARLAIEDVIGEYIELKRAGRNFKGLSPFTSERTPSFFVSPEKNIWHDFSSNKGGDVFSFVMEVEGFGFREALEHLARKANVDLSIYESAKSKNIATKKKRLYEINELAAHFFQHHMIRDRGALEYIFRKRKIDKKTAAAFRLGYSPLGGNDLVSFLQKKGFSRQDIKDSGVTNRFGGDLFKGRLMIPLMDGGGRVIGFTGRILADDPNAPKYLNTPSTLLYDKSWHVFGFSQAKEGLRRHDYAVVVEGNLDAVSSWQAGVTQTVATAGTAMTIHHLKTIGRITPNIRLAFDGDEAGLKATERAIPIAQEAGVELSIVTLPDYAKDPDELIQKDISLWQSVIDAAEPVLEWVLRQYAKRHDLSSAAGKRTFTSAAIAVIRSLKDPVEQEHYIKKVSDMSNSSVRAVKQKMSQQTPSKKHLKPINKSISGQIDTDEFRYEDDFLAITLIDQKARGLLQSVEAEYMNSEDRVESLLYLKEESESLQKAPEYVKILSLRADARYAGWSDQDRYHEAARLLRRIKDEHKKQQKDELTDALRLAEMDGNEELMRELLQKIQVLNREIHS
ncbi:DNA primase [Candidatus Saccharibacteria bacterium]|jgi:DNA primase|nr:DNA primase [Candidatus Saccharibacteria bacterium]